MVDLKPGDIKTGKTFRAKRPKILAFTNSYNDRTVIWMAESSIQYDGPAVRNGSRYPTVTIERFLKWASHEVEETDG